jgi:two-component system, LuxR family, sensor kinase FixL
MSVGCEAKVPCASAENSLVTHLPQPLAGQVRWQSDSIKAEISQHHLADAGSRDDSVLSAAIVQLKASESRLRGILDTVPDAIFTMNADGNIESFNKAAEVLFGYSAAEVIGKDTARWISLPGHEYDRCLREYSQTDVKRISDTYREVIGLKADGTKIPLEFAISEVRCGDRLLFTGVVRDISALKQALRQLKESNDELASQTLAIAQFNQRLQCSNDELSQFAYVASHDLQEPLR